jgi:hypothetical protein
MLFFKYLSPSRNSQLKKYGMDIDLINRIFTMIKSKDRIQKNSSHETIRI